MNNFSNILFGKMAKRDKANKEKHQDSKSKYQVGAQLLITKLLEPIKNPDPKQS